MDIGIPREGYDRFLLLCETELKGYFDIYTFQSNPEYNRYFARIEDSKIKLIRNDKVTEEVSSAWIDIFPLDGMLNNKIIRSIWKYYILYLRAIYRFLVLTH